MLTWLNILEICLTRFHCVPFWDFLCFLIFLSLFTPDVACWRDGGKSASSSLTPDQDEKPGQDESTAGTSEQSDILKVVEKTRLCDVRLWGRSPTLLQALTSPSFKETPPSCFCLPSQQLICGLPSSSSSFCTPSFPISTTSLRPSYLLQAELCPELPMSKCSIS